MSLWRQLTRGLRVFTNRAAADQDVNDEVRHYMEQAARELQAKGLSPEEARRQAQQEFGNETIVREQVRSYGWENLLGTLLADLRYSARRLRNHLGFTIVGALTLALGIGASTAIFSAVNPILFESLPYPQPDRLVAIWDVFRGAPSFLAFHSYREIVQRYGSLESAAVSKTWQPTLTGPEEPERFEGQNVSAGYFHVLGVAPAMGRDFTESDDRLKGPKVVILSDALWRRRFGASRGIIGREVKLDGDLYQVIGVTPANFENVLAPAAQIWSPLQYDATNSANFNTQEWGHHLLMVARLRPGVKPEQVRPDLEAIVQNRVPEFPRPPWAALKFGFIVHTLQQEITQGVKPALLAVLGAVILVLVIACVNVTNLLLARGAQRRGEFAMRTALGARRSRLMRQLLTESLLLAAVGGIFGILVAETGVRVLVALSPPGLPRVNAIHLNGSVLLFAFVVTTLIGLLVGLLPALQASRSAPHTGIRENSSQAAGGRNWTRRTLVAAEVALALVLLVSAGLLLRSLQRLFAVEKGFDSSQLLTMQVQTAGHQFHDDAVRHRFFEQALEAVQHVPGVAAASFTSLLPLSGDQFGEYGTQFEKDQGGYDAFRYVVSPGYFETMGIAIRRGRALNNQDNKSAQPAVVISDSLAKRALGDQDPMGQRIHIGPLNRPWYVVVGVAADVKQTSLGESKLDAVYITSEQSWFADEAMSLAVRGRGDVVALVPSLRRAIWSVDKDQPIGRVATMPSLLAGSEAERHFALILFEAFALAALLLAAIGIYGVLSGSVAERTREIGVRSALGASRGDILTLVLRQGMMLTVAGLVIGLAGALAASRALIALLFGVSQFDPITYMGVSVLLLAISIGACWAPAWRAARIDPSVALRAE